MTADEAADAIAAELQVDPETIATDGSRGVYLKSEQVADLLASRCLSYACPHCGEEVDLREAQAI